MSGSTADWYPSPSKPPARHAERPTGEALSAGLERDDDAEPAAKARWMAGVSGPPELRLRSSAPFGPNVTRPSTSSSVQPMPCTSAVEGDRRLQVPDRQGLVIHANSSVHRILHVLRAYVAVRSTRSCPSRWRIRQRDASHGCWCRSSRCEPVVMAVPWTGGRHADVPRDPLVVRGGLRPGWRSRPGRPPMGSPALVVPTCRTGLASGARADRQARGGQRREGGAAGVSRRGGDVHGCFSGSRARRRARRRDARAADCRGTSRSTRPPSWHGK